MPSPGIIDVAIASFLVSATIMSVIAVATQEWIVQDLHGTITYGLTQICRKPPFATTDTTECSADQNAPTSWTVTLVFVSFGTLALGIAAALSVMSFIDHKRLNQSKWFGLSASVAFCFATLIFPAGFDHHDVGGTTYRLPDNANIGFSYILFILALLFIFFAEMLTLKLLFEQ